MIHHQLSSLSSSTTISVIRSLPHHLQIILLRGSSVGALAILFLYSSGFTSSPIHLLLTKLYLDCITTHHPKVKLLDGKIQTSSTGCKSLLLSNRRHQLSGEQALQSYCPVSSGSLQYTSSGHPMFGETAIINCVFKIRLCVVEI